jgi:hypothetical protein
MTQLKLAKKKLYEEFQKARWIINHRKSIKGIENHLKYSRNDLTTPTSERSPNTLKIKQIFKRLSSHWKRNFMDMLMSWSESHHNQLIAWFRAFFSTIWVTLKIIHIINF